MADRWNVWSVLNRDTHAFAVVEGVAAREAKASARRKNELARKQGVRGVFLALPEGETPTPEMIADAFEVRDKPTLAELEARHRENNWNR